MFTKNHRGKIDRYFWMPHTEGLGFVIVGELDGEEFTTPPIRSFSKEDRIAESKNEIFELGVPLVHSKV